MASTTGSSLCSIVHRAILQADDICKFTEAFVKAYKVFTTRV